MPAGEGRDAAIVGSSEYWVLRNQPMEIITMIESIANAQVRADTLVNVLNTWLERDATPARQWISQVNLPVAVTGKLNGG